MSDKYIKLEFCNAKLFTKDIKTKDFVANLDLNSKGKIIFTHSRRADEKISSFREPVTVHQISNALHTLIGERPIPSFRKTFYKRNEDVFNLALSSFINIDSPTIKVKRKGEDFVEFIPELIKLDKSVWNSWAKPKNIHWFKIKKYMNEHFDEFVELMNQALGYNVLSKPFESIAGLSKTNENLSAVIDFLLEKKKTPIINFLNKDDADRSEITKNSILGETISSGIDNANFLSGEIIVPYNEAFVNKIIKNATNILDGGYVEIVGVFYADELGNIDDFKPVRDISTEKY
jgi:hypothetical protein